MNKNKDGKFIFVFFFRQQNIAKWNIHALSTFINYMKMIFKQMHKHFAFANFFCVVVQCTIYSHFIVICCSCAFFTLFILWSPLFCFHNGFSSHCFWWYVICMKSDNQSFFAQPNKLKTKIKKKKKKPR